MLENIKIYTSDSCWNHILSDLGMCVVESPDAANVLFDDIVIQEPVSVSVLQNMILAQFDNNDIIVDIFGRNMVFPDLQHKIIIALYKNPNIKMSELKLAVGLSPNITTHSVENAIYQLRKTFGRDFIVNENGGYKIGRI